MARWARTGFDSLHRARRVGAAYNGAEKENERMETETDLTCPVCDSVNVTGDTFDMVTGAAWQDVSCDDCGSSWTDCYGFTGRQDIREGNRSIPTGSSKGE